MNPKTQECKELLDDEYLEMVDLWFGPRNKGYIKTRSLLLSNLTQEDKKNILLAMISSNLDNIHFEQKYPTNR